MLSKGNPYRRNVDRLLRGRLEESRRFIQVVSGPRQVGKTTSVTRVLAEITIPTHYATADSPTIQTPLWIEQQWEQARVLATDAGSAALALDGIQKVQGWSEQVKLLWDEDTRTGRDVRVVILGSSPLLMQAGLGDSLAGRFEIIPATH
ncbi:MAG: AAA family ATPase [Thermoleophilia bacterium]